MGRLISHIVKPFAGAFKHTPQDLHSISPGAMGLIEQIRADIPMDNLVDIHMHLTGMPECGNDIYINPAMRSIRRPIQHLKYTCFKSAGGVSSILNADTEYVQRLIDLVDGLDARGRFCLLAMDAAFDHSGQHQPKRTAFSVPNEYLWKVCQSRPDLFEPVVSIHPYRPDALDILKKWHERSVRMVKWLPNGMGMDVRDDRCIAFCRKMQSYGMILLTHTGKEDSIDSRGRQHLGSPLLLRSILETGVTVIMAHCGSTGKYCDTEGRSRKKVSAFELFARLMDDRNYDGHLFGDLSAIAQFNRNPEHLRTLLNNDQWHHRLINGSDYPLPAINLLIRTGRLKRQQFITADHRVWLNEIYHCNPLLFDIAVKYCLKDHETGAKFDPIVFSDPFNGRFANEKKC